MLGGQGLSRSAVLGKAGSLRPLTCFVSARSLSYAASRARPTFGLRNRAQIGADSLWKPAAVSGLSFTRFNSTSTGDIPNDSIAALDNILPDIKDIPERLGYLKELGLDYGWGPSAFMEWTIEHIHILGGLPWWASIVTAAVAVRLAMLKPSITASDNAAKTMPIRDKISSLRAQRTVLMTQGKQLEAAKLKEEQDQIYKSLGIKIWTNFVPLLQIPLGFGCFRVIRGMTTLPVPGLATEHFNWIHDLTTYDPLFVLPVATTVFMYYSLKKAGDSGMNELVHSSIGRSMMIGLPAISLIFIAFQPAALQLYFAATGLFALGQSYLINTPSTRALLGMTPISRPDPAAAASSRAAQLRMIEESMNSIRTQLDEKKISEMQTSAAKTGNVSFIDKFLKNTKQEVSKMKTEMNEKIEKFRGGGNTNADGTPAAPPRLTEAEKQEAENYRQLREDEDRLRRAKQNRARLQQFEAKKQRAPAAKTWRDVKQAAQATTSKGTTRAKEKSKHQA